MAKKEYFVPIGLAVMRDEVTGAPKKPYIPLYAKSKVPPDENGIHPSEVAMLGNLGKAMLDLFKPKNFI